MPGEVGIADLEIAGDRDQLRLLAGRLGRLHLRAHIDAEDEAYHHHCQDDADDAEGIGHGVAEAEDHGCRLRGAALPQRLLGGGQARGVGRRPRQQAGARHGIHAPELDEEDGHAHTQHDDGGGEEIQAHAARLQQGEEARADLEAEGVDEENQAEFPDKFQHPQLDVQAEVPEGQAGEQHTGDPERDSPNLDFAQGGASRDGHRQDEHGAGYGFMGQKLKKPVHLPILPARPGGHTANLGVCHASGKTHAPPSARAQSELSYFS